MKVELDSTNPQDKAMIDILFKKDVVRSNNTGASQSSTTKPTSKGAFVKGEKEQIEGYIGAITKDNTGFKLKDSEGWYFFNDTDGVCQKGDKISGDYHKRIFKNKKGSN